MFGGWGLIQKNLLAVIFRFFFFFYLVPVKSGYDPKTLAKKEHYAVCTRFDFRIVRGLRVSI